MGSPDAPASPGPAVAGCRSPRRSPPGPVWRRSGGCGRPTLRAHTRSPPLASQPYIPRLTPGWPGANGPLVPRGASIPQRPELATRSCLGGNKVVTDANRNRPDPDGMARPGNRDLAAIRGLERTRPDWRRGIIIRVSGVRVPPPAPYEGPASAGLSSLSQRLRSPAARKVWDSARGEGRFRGRVGYPAAALEAKAARPLAQPRESERLVSRVVRSGYGGGANKDGR